LHRAFGGGGAAALHECVAKALACQRPCEQVALLSLAALHADHLKRVIVVLRNLAERAVGRRNQRHDLRERCARDARAAEFARHGDTPQTRLGKTRQLFIRGTPLSIALRRFTSKCLRKRARHVERFCVGTDDGGQMSGLLMDRLGHVMVGFAGVRSTHVAAATRR
jgi:hypothetical protein